MSKNNSNTNESIAITSISTQFKIVSFVFYLISFLLGVGGNLLVLLVTFFYKPVKSVINCFIVNLAIADLIFVLLSIPSTYLTAYLIQYWPFSNFLCIFFNYMQTVSVTLTVYTLICITLDKFWALVKPLRPRMSIKISKYLISISWMFSLIVSIPIALFTKLIEEDQTQSNNTAYAHSIIYLDRRPQCAEKWPHNLEYLSFSYNLSLLMIQYFIPLVILTFCYVKIGFVLIRAKAPGEIIQRRDAIMSQSKKK